MGGKALFAGGIWDYDMSWFPISSDVVDIYDAQTATWSTTSLSEPRDLLGAASVDDRAFFGGGGFFPQTDRVDIYDPGANPGEEWSTGSLSVARERLGATASGNKVFFAGGLSFEAVDESSNSSNVVDIYDAGLDTWSTASLSVGRMAMAATSVGDKALFGGGFVRDQGIPPFESNVVDIYDADANPGEEWSTATLSQERSYLTATTVGHLAMFAGGRVESVSTPFSTDTVDIYNSDTDQWSTAHLSVARGNLASASVGNFAFFAGGLNDDGPSDVVDIYNAQTDTWTTTILSVARGALTATAVGNMVMFAGGYGVDGFSDVVDIFIVPELLPGDANGDGVVSADDYASVQSNFGNTGHAGIPGDANGTGTVSADDYGSVQLHFGDTRGMGGETAVPEPASAGLLLLGFSSLLWRRIKR